MLSDIKKFFEEKLQLNEPDVQATNTGIEYATAALLIELAKSDFEEDELERQLIVAMLRDTFSIDGDDLDELITRAETASADASDLFQFTSLINEHYSNEQKILLLENFWKVAYADGRLDKYEETFIRKIAGLLHLPAAEFSKTKMRVKESLEG